MEGHRVKGPVFNAAGEIVKPGDPLVSIQDPDPELPRRLSLQRVAVQERITAARDRIASFTAQIKALEQSQRQALIAAENRLRMADERLKAAREAVVIARLRREIDATNFQMEKELVRDGLTSQLTFLAAQQRKDQALAEEKRSLNSKDAALVEVDAIRADMEKIRADAVASISSATASRQSAEAELATATRDMAQMETSIARQSAQEVTAPCDGTVYRILCNSARGGSLVKSGERLMIITPDIRSDAHRDVELFLDGNDAPQLTELWKRRLEADSNADIHVRIQFEGWPAIQVVGWPSIAWGTFSGKVVMVDPHDDGKGRFRIMVQPDPNAEPWPNEFSLRQGTRAQGWVLLDRVSLGYELWRRFNGFPPVVVDKDKDDGDKQKPGKVKVPK
jgi:biotin carboxyl carrier protein